MFWALSDQSRVSFTTQTSLDQLKPDSKMGTLYCPRSQVLTVLSHSTAYTAQHGFQKRGALAKPQTPARRFNCAAARRVRPISFWVNPGWRISGRSFSIFSPLNQRSATRSRAGERPTLSQLAVPRVSFHRFSTEASGHFCIAARTNRYRLAPSKLNALSLCEPSNIFPSFSSGTRTSSKC